MTPPLPDTPLPPLPEALSLSGLERAIGLQSWEWPGRCFEISRALVQKMGVEGRAAYGFWTGPITPSMFFDGSAARVRHGWVVIPDGRIIDPTRFVFEHAEPYIYVGPNDHYASGQSVAWRVAPPDPNRIPQRGKTAARRRLQVRAQTRSAHAPPAIASISPKP